MLDRVKELADKHGRKVSLVGWSLGGIYARQLAKMLPDEVRCGDHARQPVQRRPARHQRLEALRIHLRPQGRRPRAPHGRRHLGLAAGADHGDLQPHRRHLRLADLRRERARRTPRASRWRRAIAALAIIRPWSTPSPTAWRSRKASGRSSTAAASRRCFIPIRGGSSLFLLPFTGRRWPVGPDEGQRLFCNAIFALTCLPASSPVNGARKAVPLQSDTHR